MSYLRLPLLWIPPKLCPSPASLYAKSTSFNCWHVINDALWRMHKDTCPVERLPDRKVKLGDLRRVRVYPPAAAVAIPCALDISVDLLDNVIMYEAECGTRVEDCSVVRPLMLVSVHHVRGRAYLPEPLGAVTVVSAQASAAWME